MTRFLCLLAACAALPLGAAAGPEAPSTISPEAVEVLATSEPVRDPTLDGMGYAEAWQMLNDAATGPEVQAQALAAFGSTMELREIDGAEHLFITPAQVDPALADHLLIYVHGGAHVFFSPEVSLNSALQAANAVGVRVLSVRYPLAWQAPFPASRDRVLAVYDALLAEYPASHLAMTGDSAGGGLILSALQQMVATGAQVPAMAGLLSPWVDISGAGDTTQVLSGVDPIIDYPLNLANAARTYAGDLPLTDPGPSPLYGRMEGLPPIFLTTGTRDLFLSDVARLQRRLLDAGVPMQLTVGEAMWHVYQVDPSLPESAAAWRDYAAFLRAAWGQK